jgi:hypothetical protein
MEIYILITIWALPFGICIGFILAKSKPSNNKDPFPNLKKNQIQPPKICHPPLKFIQHEKDDIIITSKEPIPKIHNDCC